MLQLLDGLQLMLDLVEGRETDPSAFTAASDKWVEDYKLNHPGHPKSYPQVQRANLIVSSNVRIPNRYLFS